VVWACDIENAPSNAAAAKLNRFRGVAIYYAGKRMRQRLKQEADQRGGRAETPQREGQAGGDGRVFVRTGRF
jgi:hypothetical protein